MFRLIALCCLLHASTAIAAGELSVLSRQLNNETSHATALQQLKAKAQQDQSALVPLFRFYCGDYVKYRGGKAYTPVRNISKFLENYLSAHTLEQPALDAMLDAVWECGRQRSEFVYQLDSLVDKVSKTQRLTGRQLDIIVRLTELHLQRLLADQTSKKNNVTYYLRVLANQTKFQRLPDRARQLALKSMQIEPRYGTIYPALGILSGQLKHGDKQSEVVLFNIARTGDDIRWRKSAISRLAQWHKQSQQPDEFVMQLLMLAENETDPQMKQAYKKSLAVFVDNEHMSGELRMKIILGAEQKDKRQLMSRLLQQLRKKALSSGLTKQELELVTGIIFGPYEESSQGQAIHVLMAQSDAQGLDKKLHEDLLHMYVQRTELRGYAGLRSLVLQNIPYRNVKGGGDVDRYPDALLRELVQDIRALQGRAQVSPAIAVLGRISEHQGLPNEAIDVLYDIFTQEQDVSLKNTLLDMLVKHYQASGYIRFDVLYADLKHWHRYYSRKVFELVLANKLAQQQPLQALYTMFSDRELDSNVRGLVLLELTRRDFDFATKKLLPPPEGESIEMQRSIWGNFENASVSRNKPVDKQLLLAATKHEDMAIRHSAWRMLSVHGIETPFLVKWEKERYRKSVYLGILLFPGAPLTLLLGTLIFLLPRKNREVKYTWTGVVRVVVWAISTIAAVVIGGGALFLAGMSHSGTPYDFINTALAVIYSVYLLIAVLMRVLTPTVPRDRNNEALES